MKLLLRTTNASARLEGLKRTDWGQDDYTVYDGNCIVGRIHRHEWIQGQRMWKGNLQTDPAPPPNTGYEPTLEDAKVAFKRRSR